MSATLLTLIEQDGPEAVSLLEQYGPTIWAALSPLIGKSISAGTLENDAPIVMAALQKIAVTLAPLLQGSAAKGRLTADLEVLADAIASFVPGLGTFVTLGELAIGIVSALSSIDPDAIAAAEANVVAVGMDNAGVQRNAKNGGV